MSDLDDFGLTEEQKLIRRNVAEMLSRVLPPEEIRRLDAASEFPHAAFDALAEAGYLALPYDPAYGGMGGSRKDLVVLVEALARHYGGAASCYLPTVVYGGMHLQMTAGEHLRRRYLPEVCAGRLKAAIALSEPDTGSDASGIRTRAVRDGNGYRLTGQKLYITAAHVADFLMVVAKTDAEARHKGVTLFWVDARAPGISMRPVDTLGRRTTHPNEIFFDGVFIPADHVIGTENKGWSGLMRGLNLERLCLAAQACGNMHWAIEYAKAFAIERRQFGQPISKFQAIQHKFADMRGMLKSTQALTYRVADMLDAGLDPVEETAIAKIQGTEGEFKCAHLAMEIMGGAGYTMAHDIQRLFRDVRVGSIGGGTNDIQRNTIAKTMGL